MAGFFRKFALWYAIAMFGIWGLILIIQPELVHAYFTAGDLNPAYVSLMGAGFVGLALISLVVQTKIMTDERALGIATGIVVATAIYGMFFTQTILVSPLTSISLVVGAAITFFLLF
ncbi:MAG: hypothetical protein ACFCUG_06145 [Thiotrichales bacterium]